MGNEGKRRGEEASAGKWREGEEEDGREEPPSSMRGGGQLLCLGSGKGK